VAPAVLSPEDRCAPSCSTAPAVSAYRLPLAGFGTAVDRVRAGQGINWHIRP